MFTLLDFINAKMIIGRRIRIQIKGVNNDIVFDFFQRYFYPVWISKATDETILLNDKKILLAD